MLRVSISIPVISGAGVFIFAMMGGKRNRPQRSSPVRSGTGALCRPPRPKPERTENALCRLLCWWKPLQPASISPTAAARFWPKNAISA
jgi:hypothetical protein